MKIHKSVKKRGNGVSNLSSVGWSFSPTSGQTAGTSMKPRANLRSSSSCPEVTGSLKIHPDVTRSLGTRREVGSAPSDWWKQDQSSRKSRCHMTPAQSFIVWRRFQEAKRKAGISMTAAMNHSRLGQGQLLGLLRAGVRYAHSGRPRGAATGSQSAESHGEDIWVFAHRRSDQVLYSFSKVLDVSGSLSQMLLLPCYSADFAGFIRDSTA